MKKVMKYIKKIFIVLAVIWTTFTLGFIGVMALSGPAHCPVDTPDEEKSSEIQNTNMTTHASLQERKFEIIIPGSLYQPHSMDSDPANA